MTTKLNEGRSQANVFERMYHNAVQQNEKTKIVQEILRQPQLDKNTGKPYFRPQTGRFPQKRETGEDIGNHLYD